MLCVRYDELYHHGIKGQRWGVRRFQNKDGSLTKAGKKRVSKQYKKESSKGDKDLAKRYSSIYANAYNKTADKFNNGLIDKFNKSQQKKYGENYAQRDGYVDDYMKIFDEHLSKTLNKSMLDFRLSNEHYQKADALVKKYDMTNWDELARSNQKGIDAVRKSLNKK